MAFALIDAAGVVRAVDPAKGPTFPGFSWQDCTATPGVTAGWTYAAGKFTPPPARPAAVVPAPPTLAQLQAELATLAARFAAHEAAQGSAAPTSAPPAAPAAAGTTAT